MTAFLTAMELSYAPHEKPRSRALVVLSACPVPVGSHVWGQGEAGGRPP